MKAWEISISYGQADDEPTNGQNNWGQRCYAELGQYITKANTREYFNGG